MAGSALQDDFWHLEGLCVCLVHSCRLQRRWRRLWVVILTVCSTYGLLTCKCSLLAPPSDEGMVVDPEAERRKRPREELDVDDAQSASCTEGGGAQWTSRPPTRRIANSGRVPGDGSDISAKLARSTCQGRHCHGHLHRCRCPARGKGGSQPIHHGAAAAVMRIVPDHPPKRALKIGTRLSQPVRVV